MANNDKGKAIYIGSEEEEWAKVLNNYYLTDLVLDGFGAEPISEYGSYRKIPKELRKQILNWLRKQDGYYEMLLGDTQEEKREAADTGIPEVDDMERRISYLEAVFKHLKDVKEKKKKKERGDAESSDSNF